MPDWAIEYARASLKIDMSVPDIEQRLVGRGLTPTAAAAAVRMAFDAQVPQMREARQRAERRILLHRIVSGIVACVCFVFAYQFNGVWSIMWTANWIAVPLACIWFGDKVKVRTWLGQVGPELDVIVRWGGWLALLALLWYRMAVVLNVA